MRPGRLEKKRMKKHTNEVRSVVSRELAVAVAEESYFGLTFPGICNACGEEGYGCEPDAEGYRCEACGADELHGPDFYVMGLGL